MVKKYDKKNKIFRGGAKQKDPAISSFDAVARMIMVPGATLRSISHASLKGFIFRLDVPQYPANSEFYTLNENKTALSKPVYSLIFKMVILSEDVDGFDELDEPLRISGDPPRTYKKEVEETYFFVKEARNQQDIYINTLSPSGNPITISVIDFSYFTRDAALKMIISLNNVKYGDPKCFEMLKYMYDNIGKKELRLLGMMTMELANSDFIELSEIPRNSHAFSLDCDYALAQILTLFTKLKKINYDCHLGNILASASESNPVLDRAVLIDFGRLVTVSENFLGDFLIDYRDPIIELYNKVSAPSNFEIDLNRVIRYNITDLFLVESGRSTNEDEVIAKMEDILKFISRLDYAINCSLFDFKSPRWDKPQITDLLKYLYGARMGTIWGKPLLTNMRWEHGTNPPNWEHASDTKEKYRRIAQNIRAIAQDPIEPRNLVSKLAIDRMIKSGEILTINMNMEAREGGRRRKKPKKTRRRSRKTRKTRRIK